MTESFEPRIVVPNDADAEIIGAALTGYLHGVFARVQLTGDYLGAIENGKRAIELLESVVDAAHREAAAREFGTVPDDATMAEKLAKLRKDWEMGE